jgi:hypothetical protein
MRRLYTVSEFTAALRAARSQATWGSEDVRLLRGGTSLVSDESGRVVGVALYVDPHRPTFEPFRLAGRMV